MQRSSSLLRGRHGRGERKQGDVFDLLILYTRLVQPIESYEYADSDVDGNVLFPSVLNRWILDFPCEFRLSDDRAQMNES